MGKNVVIFAGNDCIEKLRAYYYAVAYSTGKLLAESGLTVVTGAGGGLMNEALRGAHEAGGKTIGIGLNIGERKQSDFAKDITLFDKLHPRQDKMIALGDAYVALPGGVGTLFEVLNIIALKRIAEMPAGKPLVL